jgi:hypothetical protein
MHGRRLLVDATVYSSNTYYAIPVARPIWALLLALSKLTPGHSRDFFRKDIHQIVGPAHTKMDEPHSQRNAIINNIPLGASSNV